MSQPVWKDAEEEFADYFKQFGKAAFVYRFKDTREARGVSGSQRVFALAQPADFLVTHKRETFFAEVKSSQNATSFPLSMIKEPQWNAAVQQVAATGGYMFFIKNETTQVWYAVPAEHLIKWKLEGVKSLKWALLYSYIWSK